jgi:hypothetical protein
VCPRSSLRVRRYSFHAPSCIQRRLKLGGADWPKEAAGCQRTYSEIPSRLISSLDTYKTPSTFVPAQKASSRKPLIFVARTSSFSFFGTPFPLSPSFFFLHMRGAPAFILILLLERNDQSTSVAPRTKECVRSASATGTINGSTGFYRAHL